MWGGFPDGDQPVGRVARGAHRVYPDGAGGAGGVSGSTVGGHGHDRPQGAAHLVCVRAPAPGGDAVPQAGEPAIDRAHPRVGSVPT